MRAIEVKNLTKDYGHGRGIFNVNLSVEKGEVYGFLGPNGAGKTTTIRNLMGFIRPDQGEACIQGKRCFEDAAKIQAKLGYLAGELAFLDDLNGRQMIQFVADMKGIRDLTRMKELIEMFELNPQGRIKKMSKGMKQKIGIVCAFMGDPDTIILDEPTSGLDPLMQNRFVDLVLEEKRKGKTIFMSSHIFEEVERTCDRTAIIRNGKIVSIENMESMKEKKRKSYIVTLKDEKAAGRFAEESFETVRIEGNRVTVLLAGHIDEFVKTLADYPVKDLNVKTSSLEEIFLQYYGEGETK